MSWTTYVKVKVCCVDIGVDVTKFSHRGFVYVFIFITRIQICLWRSSRLVIHDAWSTTPRDCNPGSTYRFVYARLSLIMWNSRLGVKTATGWLSATVIPTFSFFKLEFYWRIIDHTRRWPIIIYFRQYGDSEFEITGTCTPRTTLTYTAYSDAASPLSKPWIFVLCRCVFMLHLYWIHPHARFICLCVCMSESCTISIFLSVQDVYIKSVFKSILKYVDFNKKRINK